MFNYYLDASILMKKKYTYLIVIFLIVASCAAFGRIADNDFVNFDDTVYITENPQIKSGINPQTIKWAFSTFVLSNWHPLTWLSHMLDWSLFGANASGHHLVSLLLHIGAVIFLFLFLNKTTNNIWPAAFATALFALHPLRVESVVCGRTKRCVEHVFWNCGFIRLRFLCGKLQTLPLFSLSSIICFEPDVQTNAGHPALCPASS